VKTIVFGVVLVVLGVALALQPLTTSLAARQPAVVVKWEYRVLTKEQIIDLGKKDLAAGLNKLGDEGWELVVAEPQYVFKRPKDQPERKSLAELQEQLTRAESDVVQWTERVAWTERMVKKGYLTNVQLEADRARLSQSTLVLDLARKALPKLPNNPKAPVEKDRQPDK
jgi:hypothetical protein